MVERFFRPSMARLRGHRYSPASPSGGSALGGKKVHRTFFFLHLTQLSYIASKQGNCRTRDLGCDEGRCQGNTVLFYYLAPKITKVLPLTEIRCCSSRCFSTRPTISREQPTILPNS